MITDLEILNFRSIQGGKVHLEPLTVIVGANSTGKSNLVKALDFISDIAQYGIHDAVYKRGGFNEILPKQIKNLNGLEIYFNFNINLDEPENWPKEFGKLTAKYELGIEQSRTGKIKIKRESLEIKSILLLSYFLDKKWDDKENKIKIDLELPDLNLFQQSSFKISRIKLNKLNFTTNVKLDSEHSSLLLNWLGIKRFFESRKDKKLPEVKELEKTINSLLSAVRPGEKSEDLPIISLNRILFGISPHLRKLVSELESISRYDLFINELRQEQIISNSRQVSVTGDNIPSVVKTFAKEDKEAWERITSTMSNISPYFSQVRSESLRAGKEYLLFEEIFNGRAIESWEASDGTLRALAILLCLESHRQGSTILIEEPEHGLHPWAVKDLMSHIKETISLKDIQVVITTHSQQVLECILQNELLITERDENGTRYNTLDKVISNPNISMGEIGDLWTRGLLKGVPISF
ncbi:MAG: AAA family ATPase [Saprospiraceae bacterium]|nr:AAA family ATPase [Candidatus Vicinibacter affinis]MBK7694304.1 AAA family ATPase [Candidatus Vicinibacter affinis]MBK8406246.1 AAA family ATPase [Candidatus Vicinibacter affinis]MBK8644519.1 AAA family ATPase [Candidatus Vicinibacter affinis]MBK9641087.1 AAA family ATPase [Candidatus Vicinibacter affinis]